MSDSAPVIVVAVDLATRADRICQAAADVARRMGARLHLAHVLDLPYALRPDARVSVGAKGAQAQAWAGLEREARARLQPLVDQLAAEGVQAEICLRHGEVVASIWECAEEAGAMMVVIGSDLPQGLKRLFSGSFTEDVLHEARCPVLVVPTQAG